MTPFPLKPSMKSETPTGDTHRRSVCNHCGFVNYQNPKIVVGSVVRHDGKILLCRRAIEPRRGFWTIPAGYLELGETPEDGARREAREEACAELQLSSLLAVYSVTHLSQVQLFYRAKMVTPHYAAGEESLEVQLFSFEDIPREDIAFPTVHWALDHDELIEHKKATGPFSNPVAE